MRKIPTSVAGYYNSITDGQRLEILEMRTRILELFPRAEEIMKYGMPTFIVNEIDACGLLANKNHIGYYPYSGSVLKEFPELSEKYKLTKGSLHVPYGKPLPKVLIKKLIMARIKQPSGS